LRNTPPSPPDHWHPSVTDSWKLSPDPEGGKHHAISSFSGRPVTYVY
jgi:hypothetical protein